MKASRGLALFLLGFALTGCGRTSGNASGNATNMVAEEGIQDVNSGVSGDELAPIPEAVDDMIANNSARSFNDSAPIGNVVVPPGR